MIGIKSREPTLTCEVFDDKFHEWNIPVLQELERKHPAKLTMIFGLDIWFIMLLADIQPFVPLSPTSGILVASAIIASERVKLIPARCTTLFSMFMTNFLANS